MNIIHGIVSDLHTEQNLSLVSVTTQDIVLTAVVIDTPQTSPYLRLKQPVKVLFKETEVIISKAANPDISLRNQVSGKINAIQSGEILSKVTLNTHIGNIISIITTKVVNSLQLKIGDKATVMIKTNEVMLSK